MPLPLAPIRLSLSDVLGGLGPQIVNKQQNHCRCYAAATTTGRPIPRERSCVIPFLQKHGIRTTSANDCAVVGNPVYKHYCERHKWICAAAATLQRVAPRTESVPKTFEI